jgi:hypothetical protein
MLPRRPASPFRRRDHDALIPLTDIANRWRRSARSLNAVARRSRAAVGDTVSVHWGWACEVLSGDQLAHLERYARHHLAIANQTI